MNYLGMFYSTSAALLWAVAVVLYKKSGETLSPIALNLFKCTVALTLLGPTLVIFNIDFFPNYAPREWIIFGVSGFMGITLADTFFFMALTRLGAGLMACVDCLYLPMVLMFSFVFLDEQLGVKGMIGAVLVMAAITIGTCFGSQMTGLPRKRASGIFFGVLAIVLIAASIVMVKR